MLLIVLSVMIVLIWKRLKIHFVLAISIVLTSFLFGRNFMFIKDMISTLKDLETWSLLLTFVLIYLLTELLTSTGVLSRMVDALERRITDTRLVLMSVPFFIGLVPAPSGAMISAPFTKQIGDKIRLKKNKQHLINYWFRHISEHINPIFPGPILAAGIVGITFSQLLIANLPLMLSVFITGFFLFILRIPKKSNPLTPTRKDWQNMLHGFWPIGLAIILPVAFGVNPAISLALAVVLTATYNHVKMNQLRKAFKKSMKIDLLLTVFLILLFREVLKSSYAIERVSSSLMHLGIPTWIIAIALPMVVGFLTGITIGYVGLTFPLLLPFFQNNISLFMLSFASGFLGILASPTHLCFSVTKEYFNVEYSNVYRHLLPAIIIVFTLSVLFCIAGWPFGLV